LWVIAAGPPDLVESGLPLITALGRSFTIVGRDPVAGEVGQAGDQLRRSQPQKSKPSPCPLGRIIRDHFLEVIA
jgi:hypothetical protein